MKDEDIDESVYQSQFQRNSIGVAMTTGIDQKLPSIRLDWYLVEKNILINWNINARRNRSGKMHMNFIYLFFAKFNVQPISGCFEYAGKAI